MRVLHLRATNFLGGPERQILGQGVELRRREIECIVGTFQGDSGERELQAAAATLGLSHVSIGAAGGGLHSLAGDLAAVARERDVDVVACHGYKAVIVTSAARLGGRARLAFLRGRTRETMRMTCYQWLEERLAGRFDGVVAVSEAELARCRRALGAMPAWVVRNAVDAQEIRRRADGMHGPETALRDASPAIVSVGRLSPEKGHDVLIDALALVLRECPRAGLWLCGDGPSRSILERKAQRLGIGAAIRFLGHRRDALAWMAAADVLVLPSLSEAMPNVLLEALSLQTPIVASRVGGVPEIIEHRESGWLVEPGNARELAQGILLVTHNSEQATAMAARGPRIVMDRLSFETQADSLETVYRTVLGQLGKRSALRRAGG